MDKIIYGILVCDFENGMDNLSCEDMLDLLGYESLDEFKKDRGYEVDEDDVYEYFDNHYEVCYTDVIEDNNLKILKMQEDGYYKGGCGPFSEFTYRVKGKEEDFNRVKYTWFVVDYEEVDLEDLFRKVDLDEIRY